MRTGMRVMGARAGRLFPDVDLRTRALVQCISQDSSGETTLRLVPACIPRSRGSDLLLDMVIDIRPKYSFWVVGLVHTR